ncbi:MAG TPA: 16S rRNA (adenine(1518)-N(6)/adenine(1519)-N(6))-dimethyltransferase RsmA [Gammaproteobacteria bacterium]|nr:16S rRNA (adenine(1518)-N(6)/adenine(1519)-N(6))-dimethyltransferase RsmA [Gammaproteobacteria bacterium]
MSARHESLEGHRARKQFGQNFLVDERIVREILAITDPRPGQRIVEIGAGLGALTAGLLAGGAELIAIEIDRDLLPRLRHRFGAEPRFSLLARDALQVDLHALAAGGRLRVVGNLPYNISSPLLFHLLAAMDVLDDATVMLQHEVAARLAAAPRCADYGRLSVAAQACCRVDLVLAVPPESFEPRPKVDSSVVRLTPHAALPSPALRLALGRITQQAFSLRRKMVRHSLGRLFGEAELAACGVDPRQRPEEIGVAQYLALAGLIEAQAEVVKSPS